MNYSEYGISLHAFRGSNIEKSFQQDNIEKAQGKWITMNGTHVFIENGKVKYGPESLRNTNEDTETDGQKRVREFNEKEDEIMSKITQEERTKARKEWNESGAKVDWQTFLSNWADKKSNQSKQKTTYDSNYVPSNKQEYIKFGQYLNDQGKQAYNLKNKVAAKHGGSVSTKAAKQEYSNLLKENNIMSEEEIKQQRIKLKNMESKFLGDINKADVPKEHLEEMIKEHERLVDVLDSPSHEDDKKESKKQKKELKEYKQELKKAFDILGVK